MVRNMNFYSIRLKKFSHHLFIFILFQTCLTVSSVEYIRKEFCSSHLFIYHCVVKVYGKIFHFTLS